MTDCIPPAESPASGPSQSLYGSFSLALALRGGAIVRAVAGWCSSTDPRRRPSPDQTQTREGPPRRAPETFALAVARRGAATIGRSLRRLSRNRRPPPDGADQIPENPPGPGHIPRGRLDPAQVEAAATAALRSILSLLQHRDNSDSDSDDDDDEISHPSNQHLGYPLIDDLEAGDAPLFFASGWAGSVGQGDGLYRSDEVADIVNKMVEDFKGVIQRTSNDIRSSKESTIHPATSVFIHVLAFFCRNRDMVESGYYNTGTCSDMFDCLMSKLKECAEKKFQEKGQKYIFFLNNIVYVFQKNYPPRLLPPTVVSDLVSLTDEFMDSYLKESWFPLMQSYLDGDSLKKPHRSSLNAFAEEFSCIYDSQATWKVQTELKKRLREEIVKLIVPKYVNFLKALQESGSSHSPSMLKWMCRARSEKPVYTCERLEEVIRNLFEL